MKSASFLSVVTRLRKSSALGPRWVDLTGWTPLDCRRPSTIFFGSVFSRSASLPRSKCVRTKHRRKSRLLFRLSMLTSLFFKSSSLFLSTSPCHQITFLHYFSRNAFIPAKRWRQGKGAMRHAWTETRAEFRLACHEILQVPLTHV